MQDYLKNEQLSGHRPCGIALQARDIPDSNLSAAVVLPASLRDSGGATFRSGDVRVLGAQSMTESSLSCERQSWGDRGTCRNTCRCSSGSFGASPRPRARSVSFPENPCKAPSVRQEPRRTSQREAKGNSHLRPVPEARGRRGSNRRPSRIPSPGDRTFSRECNSASRDG